MHGVSLKSLVGSGKCGWKQRRGSLWKSWYTSTYVLLSVLACAVPSGAQEDDLAPFRKRLQRPLPDWVSIEPEIRFRYEGRRGNGFEIEDAENALLTRYLLGIRLTPHKHFEFYVQGMDARMLGPRREVQTDRYRNIGEVREAWVRIGDAEGPVSLQAGRILHRYGFQRLLAPANWSNSRRAFDAVKLSLGRPGERVDIFTGSEVEEFMSRPDWSDYGNGIHGIYGDFANWLPGTRIEPYFLFRTRREVTGELGTRDDAETLTAGARISGRLQSGWDFDVEMARQTGNFGGDELDAWASNWLLGYTFANASWTPRIYGFYLFASGDEDPLDGRAGTFDQHPAANHVNRGIADLIGWRNLKNPSIGLDIVPSTRWKIKFEQHFFWLASANDAYYTFSGDPRAPRVPGGAESTHIGDQIDVVASCILNRYTTIGAGVGHIWRGGFLKRHTDIRSSTFPYLYVEWKP